MFFTLLTAMMTGLGVVGGVFAAPVVVGLLLVGIAADVVIGLCGGESGERDADLDDVLSRCD